MNFQPKALPPYVQPENNYMGELEKALGQRNKLNSIKQKNASYPPPQAPQKKVYSPRPDSVDL